MEPALSDHANERLSSANMHPFADDSRCSHIEGGVANYHIACLWLAILQPAWQCPCAHLRVQCLHGILIQAYTCEKRGLGISAPRCEHEHLLCLWGTIAPAFQLNGVSGRSPCCQEQRHSLPPAAGQLEHPGLAPAAEMPHRTTGDMLCLQQTQQRCRWVLHTWQPWLHHHMCRPTLGRMAVAAD